MTQKQKLRLIISFSTIVLGALFLTAVLSNAKVVLIVAAAIILAVGIAIGVFTVLEETFEFPKLKIISPEARERYKKAAEEHKIRKAARDLEREEKKKERAELKAKRDAEKKEAQAAKLAEREAKKAVVEVPVVEEVVVEAAPVVEEKVEEAPAVEEVVEEVSQTHSSGLLADDDQHSFF